MRQAGILADAAEYGLRDNLPRISEDHEKARIFASQLEHCGKVRIVSSPVETNMVIFDVSGIGRSRDDFLTLMARAGVLFTPERESQVRAVMHLDVTPDDVKTAGIRTLEVL